MTDDKPFVLDLSLLNILGPEIVNVLQGMGTLPYTSHTPLLVTHAHNKGCC